MKSQKAEKSGGKSAPGEGELHPPPSMLWFVVPLLLLMIYAALTR